MHNKFLFTIAVGLGVWLFAQSSSLQAACWQANAQTSVSANQVRKAIRKGGEYLLSSRNNQGRWPEVAGFKAGSTGLCTLALLNAGVPPEKLKHSLSHLEQFRPQDLSTYALSLRIMVFALADPQGRRYLGKVRADVQQLEKLQVAEGKNIGGWSYGHIRGNNGRTADASNSQFAILALHEASLLGLPVEKDVWKRAKIYWDNLNRRGSGFHYNVGQGTPVIGSMTCAGISSMIIINENLANAADFLKNGQVVCCGTDQDLKIVQDAINWMGKNFSVKFNPVARGQRKAGSKMYYLYGMERAGRLSGERFFGDHDWYREGAAHLIKQQKSTGGWRSGGHGENAPEIATAFGLLFLAKGKRPVVFGKYQHSQNNDWDRHPQGVHYLTRQVEDDWNLKLNWQTVRAAGATADDLLEAPVLFISGRDKLVLTEEQELALKKYVENGGFIFAEACQGDGCGNNVPFEKSFRELVGRLFPDSEMGPLAIDHPIWQANTRIKPLPGWEVHGVQACCRTSIVFCSRNMSGYWRLNRKNLMKEFPANVKEQVKWTTEFGVNVAAYATGRQLEEKLGTTRITEVKDFSVIADRALVFAKLNHGGGADDAPNAWRNLQDDARQFGVENGRGGQEQVELLRIKTDKKMIDPVKEQLAEHPFVFMHGRENFAFSDEEKEAVRRYLELGGCVFADSICSSPAFANAFRREFNALFPDKRLEVVDKDHEIFTSRYGHSLNDGVTLNIPDASKDLGFRQEEQKPLLEGIEVNGRLAVIFSPNDLSCALENATANQCRGYTRDDAVRIGTNVILYRLRSD